MLWALALARQAVAAGLDQLLAQTGRAELVDCWCPLHSQPPGPPSPRLNLPVEPGVHPGRDALAHWAVLLQEILLPEVVSGPSSQPDASGAAAPGRISSAAPSTFLLTRTLWARNSGRSLFSAATDVTPECRQALSPLLRATNGPAGRTPGPFLSEARTTGVVAPPRHRIVHQMFLSFSKCSAPSWY
jgi:hypothetical protein